MKPTIVKGSPSKELRFALVGCGRIAQSHLEAMSALDDVKLAVVVEPREGAGKAVAEQFGCRLYPDYRSPEVFDQVDAAVICAPPSVHFEMAKTFLESGVHVLCEKPLTITSKDARDLVKAADARGLQR